MLKQHHEMQHIIYVNSIIATELIREGNIPAPGGEHQRKLRISMASCSSCLIRRLAISFEYSSAALYSLR